MKRRSLAVFGALAVGLGAAGSVDAGPSTATRPPAPAQQAVAARQYLIIARGNALPAGLNDRVAAAGGAITSTVPEIGIAVASSTSPDFAAVIRGVAGIRSVSSAPNIRRVPDRTVEGVSLEAYGNPPTSGDNDPFFDLQWGHDAVDAPEAWNEGRRGAGTRVAVLDTGFFTGHPDLAPNIVATASFVPGETVEWAPDDPADRPFSHGTHTAGTVGAADNGRGTIGVAPETDLVLVKVLPDAGCGGDGPILAGIVHASGPADADVINMSLGAPLEKRGYLEPGCDPDDPADDVLMSANDVAEIRHAYDRAVSYANAQGTTVIASAGNDASDADHTADLIHLPSDTPGVISISATAPIGWAKAPATTFLDNLASYSNFGRSVIEFAAPGGDAEYPGNENCTIAGLTRPCWVFDLVFSTGGTGWYWSAGTSMAAPHAAGVAALIIGANGGEMKPSRVERELRRTADRITGAGNSAAYGAGRVDATDSVEGD